ncbi:MAG: tetratricopeptide repeat protein, partial [Blastocatellia bacterium]|nr:tetratricopeptide repeat protein [Blastocatellia bacterium]
RMLGEMQKAMDNFNESLMIRREIGDHYHEANSLNNIGNLYYILGEKQKALEYFNEALPIFRTAGDRRNEAIMLNNIGQMYYSLGETQKAMETYNQALPISRAVGDRGNEAIVLSNIGNAYYTLGEKRKALENHQQAQAIFRLTGDRRSEAFSLSLIGRIYQSLGEGQKAMDNFNIALPIQHEKGDRRGEADTLLNIAREEQNRGELTRACEYIGKATAIVESLRAGTASEDLRASYLADQLEFYGTYIDILMQMHRQNPSAGRDAAALAVSERARARTLLELLAEARADIRQGVDSLLIERERSLQQRLAPMAIKQISLLAGRHTPEQAEAMAREIAGITDEYEKVEAKIRASSPRYIALTQPQPLNLSEIQKQVLDADTLLLEYRLGKDASYLFVVSQDSISTHQLPKRAEIEAATRGVYELLTAPQLRPGDSSLSLQARMANARNKYWPQAAALSRMLLGPAAEQLKGKRLLIVGDGALQYLPFGALPIPVGDRESVGEEEKGGRKSSTINRRPLSHSPTLPLSPPVPLIVEHEIVNLPSASTLAVLRRELAGRKPAPKEIAVLADPVFSPDDGRVKHSILAQGGQANNEKESDLTRALRDVREGLTRLPLTREEAQAIVSLAPPNERLEALDFRASRATATSSELSQYRIVHFATHGLLNSEHPKLSGLVLSLVDQSGQP